MADDLALTSDPDAPQTLSEGIPVSDIPQTDFAPIKITGIETVQGPVLEEREAAQKQFVTEQMATVGIEPPPEPPPDIDRFLFNEIVPPRADVLPQVHDSRPPTEAEARRAANKIIPLATDEEVAVAEHTVRRFLESQQDDERAAQIEWAQSYYTDANKYKQLAEHPDVKLGIELSPDPELFQQTSVNNAWLNANMGRKLSAPELEIARKHIGKQLFNIPEISNQQFFSKMQEWSKGQAAEKELVDNLDAAVGAHVLSDQLNRTYTPDYQVLEKLKKENPEVITPENERKFSLLNQRMHGRMRQLGESVREPYAQVFGLLQKTSQEKRDPTQEEWRTVIDSLSAIDPEEKKTMWGMVGRAARTGIVDKEGLARFIENMSKGWTREFNLSDRTERNAEMQLDDMRKLVDSGVPLGIDDRGRIIQRVGIYADRGRPLTEAERIDYKARLDRTFNAIGIVREAQEAYETIVDPIRPVFDKGLLSAGERGLYALPAMGKLMIGGAIPGVGWALTFDAIQADIYRRTRLENPNMPVKDVAQMATISSALQTIPEQIQIGLPLGKFGKLLETDQELLASGFWATAKTFTKKAAKGTAAEFMMENFQDAVDMFYPAIQSQFDPNMKRQDVGEVAWQWLSTRPEVFAAVLVPGSVAAGVHTYKDLKNPIRSVFNSDVLRGMGIREDGIERILSKGTFEEMQAQLRVENAAVTSEDRAHGHDYITATAATTAARQSAVQTPSYRVVTQKDGSKVFEVLDATGKVVFSNTDEDLAQAAYADTVTAFTTERLAAQQAAAASEEGQAATAEAETENRLLEVPLTGPEFARNVGMSGRELIQRLIVNEPILGESDSVAIQNVKLGFVQAVASAQDAANRLNVAVSILPEERGNVLVETSHDREGNITVSIGPEAFESLWNIAYAQRGAFQALSGDVLTEELIHAADLAVARDAWLKLPEDKRGAFDAFVQNDRHEIFHDVRLAREKASPQTKAAIDGALIDAYRLYFERQGKGAPVLRDADKILALLERGESRDVNHVVFAAELVRMLTQMERTGRITETGVSSMIGRLKAWVMRAINRLKATLGAAKKGELGEMLRARLDAISVKMEGVAPIKPTEAAPSEGTLYSVFSPRGLREVSREESVAAALERMHAAPAERLRLLERIKREYFRIRAENAAAEAAAGTEEGAVSEMRRVHAFAELNALVKALPPEIRGRIGGALTLAKARTTELSLTDFLVKRIAMIDRELERALRKEYQGRIRELLARFKPKRAPSGVVKGRIGADAQDVVNRVKVYTDLPDTEIEARVSAIELQLAAGGLTPEEESALIIQQNELNVFGDIEHQTAEELATAYEALRETIHNGRAAWQISEEERLGRMRTESQEINSKLPKGTSPGIAARNRKQVRNWFSNFIASHFSFAQILEHVLPKVSFLERWQNEARRSDMADMDFVRDVTARLGEALRIAVGKNSAVAVGEALQKMEQPTIDGPQGKMSKREAIQYLQAWAQESVRPRMIAQGWTPEHIATLMRETSDPVSQALMGFFRQEYDHIYDRANEVYRRQYGMNLPQYTNYAPMRYHGAGREMENLPTGGPMAVSGVTPSAIKGRVAHNAPLRQVDALQVFLEHVYQMSHWIQFADLTREMRGVLNNVETKMALQQQLGEKGFRDLTNQLDTIVRNGASRASDVSSVNQALRYLATGQAISSLAFNPRTAAMQLDSAARWMLVVPARRWIPLLVSGKWFSAIPKAWHSTTVQRRLIEGMSPDVKYAMDAGNLSPTRLLQLARIGMAHIRYLDAAATSLSSALVYTDAINQGFSHEQALDRMDDAVARFSQPTGITSKSQLEITSSAGIKMLMMFMSDPRLKTAILVESIGNLAKGKNIGMALQRIAVVEGMAILSQLVANLYAHAISDDDDEEMWWAKGFGRAAMLAPFQGFFLVGSIAEATIAAVFGERALGKSAPGAQIVSRATQAVKHLDYLKEGITEENFWREVDNIMKTIGLTFGPAAGPAAITNAIKPAMGAYRNIKED